MKYIENTTSEHGKTERFSFILLVDLFSLITNSTPRQDFYHWLVCYYARYKNDLRFVHTSDVRVVIAIAIVSVVARVLRPSVNQYDVSAR